MQKSILETQTTVVVLVEFFTVVGVFSLILLLYTHKKVFRELRGFVCRLRRRKGSPSNSNEDGQAAGQDVEKGAAVEQPGPTIESSSLTRVLSYLHGLPRESGEYITMREVSLDSFNGLSGSVIEEGTEEGTEDSADSNWIEIVQHFPAPPDSALLRRVLEERDISGLGLSLILDQGELNSPAGTDEVSRPTKVATLSVSECNQADATTESRSEGAPRLSVSPDLTLVCEPIGLYTIPESPEIPSAQSSEIPCVQGLEPPTTA